MEASYEWDGKIGTAEDSTLREVAQVVGREVREVDLKLIELAPEVTRDQVAAATEAAIV